jgi:hypothetical protein
MSSDLVFGMTLNCFTHTCGCHMIHKRIWFRDLYVEIHPPRLRVLVPWDIEVSVSRSFTLNRKEDVHPKLDISVA